MYIKKRKKQKTSTPPPSLVPETLSPSYQEDLVRLLVQNRNFLEKLSIYLNPEEHLDFDHLKWVAQTTIDFYFVYKVCPQKRSLLTILETEARANNINDSLFRAAKDFIEDADQNVADENFAVDMIQNWMSHQEILKRISKMVDICTTTRDRALLQEEATAICSIGINFGRTASSYIQDTENALLQRKSAKQSVVPSGLPVDVHTQYGGMAKQHVCVVLAGTNVGKTSALVHIGASGVKAKKTVAHIVLESPKEELRLRYDAAFCDMSMGMIPENDWLVRDTAKKMAAEGDFLHYERFSPGLLSPLRVRQWLNQLISDGNRPDLLIVDSADDMVPDSGPSTSVYHDADLVYLGLLQIAEEYNIVVWTSSQGNRESLEADTVTLRMVGDSLKKVQRASFVVALCQSFQESICSPPQGRLFVAKNRWGRKNIIEKVFYAWSKQRVESFTLDASGGIDA